MQNIIKSIIKNCFNIVFLISFGYILYSAIFQNEVNFFKWNKYIVIFGVLVNTLILILVYKYLKKKTRINTKVLVISYLMCVFVVQCIIGHLFKVEPNWDMKDLFDGAISYINGNNKYLLYLYRYGNNIAIQIIYIILFKIADFIKIISYYDVAMLFNIIMIDMALLFTYLVAKKMFDEKKAFMIFISTSIITPIYLFAPIIYTDTISMVFPLLILFFYLSGKDSQELKRKIIFYFSMGIVAYIGMCIKPTVLITLIAIVIYEIVNFSKKELILTTSMILIALTIGVLSSNMAIKLVFKGWNNLVYNNERFPATHWIMMGLEGVGKYNQKDVDATASFIGVEQKREYNIKEIEKRLNNIIKIEKINFIREKLMYTWGDGTYYAVNTLDFEAINEGLHQQFVFKRGKYHEFYQYYTQIQHITTMFLMVIVTISSIRKEISYSLILRISIFGLFLFLLIWETRSRYLINYLPIMQIIAFEGVECLYKIVTEKRVGKTNIRKYNLHKGKLICNENMNE